MPTVADLIVSALRAAGVRALFGVPGGGSNLDVIEAAGRRGLPFVLTSTETAAALAAVAQAEVTGACGACLTTLGPGATAVVNGVACAWLDRASLVVFTDSPPASAAGRFEHQRLDHAALMRSITNWTGTLSATDADVVVREALQRAVGPRPGPVHLDCPGDVAAAVIESAPGRDEGRDEDNGNSSRRDAADSALAEPDPVPDPALAQVRSLVAAARRPLLLVGLGARHPEDVVAIRAFCERHNVPAMVTYKAKGVVPDHHPLFAGVFTNARIERAVVDRSDLLIGVGLDPVELLPRPWTSRQPILCCGRWPVEDRHLPFSAQLIGDIASALDSFGASIVSDWNPRELRVEVARQRDAIDLPAPGLTAQRVVRLTADRFAGRARVVVDAGAHMFPATMLWPAAEANEMLISNGLSTMGFALPASVGAALLDRPRRVVALTGDGGLLMCAGELLTAARERLPVTVVVFADASLSLIEIKQRAKRFRPDGVALGDVAWPALAGSFGIAAFRADDERDLERALDEAAAMDGPALVEARIDRSNYGATMSAIRG